MPKRQHANDAEHAGATVNSLVFFKFIVLFVEQQLQQQFLERIRQSIEHVVIERVRWL